MKQSINFSRVKLKESQERSKKKRKRIIGDLLIVGILNTVVIVAFGSGIILTHGE